jgi:hypothetical protein
MCPGLNANYLGGLQASDFLNLSSAAQTKIGDFTSNGNITAIGNLKGTHLIEQSTTFTPSGVGWYRIVTSTTSTAGRIILRGSYDNGYADVDFFFVSNGFSGGGSIQQINATGYNSLITAARVSSDGGANIYLDIYVGSATAPTALTIYGYGPQLFGFLSTPVSGATPGSADAVTLNFSKGIGCSGNIFARTFQSLVPTGIAPLVVASTTVVGNLQAQFAQYLYGGAPGGLPYQTAANTTAFLSIGAAGFICVSNGSIPGWVDPASIAVGSSTISLSSLTAYNLAGGLAGSVPYQSAAGVTTFIGLGTQGYHFTSDGSTGPLWEKEKSTALLGDGYATTFVVAHGITRGGLATTDVIYQLIRVSDGAIGNYASSVTSTLVSGVPKLTLTFAVAPTTNQYRLVVLG